MMSSIAKSIISGQPPPLTTGINPILPIQPLPTEHPISPAKPSKILTNPRRLSIPPPPPPPHPPIPCTIKHLKIYLETNQRCLKKNIIPYNDFHTSMINIFGKDMSIEIKDFLKSKINTDTINIDVLIYFINLFSDRKEEYINFFSSSLWKDTIKKMINEYTTREMAEIQLKRTNEKQTYLYIIRWSENKNLLTIAHMPTPTSPIAHLYVDINNLKEGFPAFIQDYITEHTKNYEKIPQQKIYGVIPIRDTSPYGKVIGYGGNNKHSSNYYEQKYHKYKSKYMSSKTT